MTASEGSSHDQLLDQTVDHDTKSRSGPTTASGESPTVAAPSDAASRPNGTVLDSSISLANINEWPEIPGFAPTDTEPRRGGMGTVFRVRQSKPDRVVALKVLNGSHDPSTSLVKRFLSEPEVMAQLSHPNILPVYDAGEHGGWLYFTTPWAEGGSLSDQLRSGREYSPEQAAETVLAVTRGLQHAHDGGVLHRDIKPSNILLDGAGKPLLADFGLARNPNADADLTGTHDILGTPQYMAPEQAIGKHEDVGVRTDVYGMGGVLYALLTGTPPYTDTHLGRIMAAVTDPTRKPTNLREVRASVPRDLETICLKCLEHAPSDRYGSAQELADDLRRFLDGEVVRARPLSRLGRTVRFARRNPLPTILIAALMVSFLGMAAAYRSSILAVRDRTVALSDAKEAGRRERLEAERAASAANRAERATQVALATLGDVETLVLDEQQLKSESFRELRDGFNTALFDLYSQLSRDESLAGSADTLLKVGRSVFRLGERHQERGASREAMRYAEETTRIADALHAQTLQSETLADAAKELAVDSRILWAKVSSRLKGSERDIAAVIATAEEAEQIAGTITKEVTREWMLSKACRCLGYMYLLNDRDKKGIPPVRRGLQHAETANALSGNPADPEILLELANAKKSTALVTYKMDVDPEHRAQIEPLYRQTLELIDQLLALPDLDPKIRKEATAMRGGVFNDRSMYFGSLGGVGDRPEMVRAGFDDAVEAVKVSQSMLANDPLNNLYRHRVAIGYWNVADRVTYFGPCETEIEARRKSISAAMPLLELHRGDVMLEIINLQRFRLCSPLLQLDRDDQALDVFKQILASGMPLDELEGGALRSLVVAVLYAKLAEDLEEKGSDLVELNLDVESCRSRAAKWLREMKNALDDYTPENKTQWLEVYRVRFDAKQILAPVFEQHTEVRDIAELIPPIDELEKSQRLIEPWPVP
ncbi:MAG: serine/threonine-protein kinase [Planctomycetota bacterium]